VCEYCGCQNIAAIATLTEEHDELRALGRDAAHAARDGDWPRAVIVCRQLRATLAPHTEIEEIGLFPPMAAEFDTHVASLRDDHRRIDSAVGDLAGAPEPPPGWRQTLESSVTELFEHILREQDGLFPASVSVLTADEWDRLDAVRQEVASRSAVPVAAVGTAAAAPGAGR
jgi:hemerythrin-like domain-containing protein